MHLYHIAFLLAAFFGSTLTTNIIKWGKKLWSERGFVIIKRLKKTANVHGVLKQTGEYLKANRVAVISYKDGYATMIYEWVDDPKKSIKDRFVNINSSSIAPMLLELQEKGSVVINQKSNDEIALIHMVININTSYKYKLYKSITEGCLVVAFEDERVLTEDEIKFIKDQIVTLKLLRLKP